MGFNRTCFLYFKEYAIRSPKNFIHNVLLRSFLMITKITLWWLCVVWSIKICCLGFVCTSVPSRYGCTLKMSVMPSLSYGPLVP